jgi:hypothetical protein
MTDQMSATLKTCSSLSSLRLDLDMIQWPPRFESAHYANIREYIIPIGFTAPIAIWKAKCKQRGLDFKIMARLSRRRPHPVQRDDLTEFWELPMNAPEDGQEDGMKDECLSRAIETYAARKAEGEVEDARTFT